MTSSPIPARRLSTAWGDMTASCDHPHRVQFNAGTTTPTLAIDGHDYLANITAYHHDPDDPNPRRQVPLVGDWHVLATDASLALTHPIGAPAPDRHQATFVDAVLPELAAWLATRAAATLVDEGTAWWRQEANTWADNTETDITAAFSRVRRIRTAISTGQIPSAVDERYLRYARVHPR